MYGIIYKAENKVNGKCYIGQTTRTLEERKNSHLFKYKNSDDCPKFYNAIKRHGDSNFIWVVIDKAKDKKELDQKEIFYIKKYNSVKSGYNLQLGGSNGKHSTESKKKMSERQKGENHPFFGKHHSEKTKRKISKALRGEKNPNYGKKWNMPNITKDKISNSLKGRKLSEAHRKQISERQMGNKNQNYGKKASSETRKKISESRKGLFIGKNNSCAKKSIFTDPQENEYFIFGEFDKFCKKNNLHSGTMRLIATNKRKSTKPYKGGWTVKYIEDN